jgi:hypothetical protein
MRWSAFLIFILSVCLLSGCGWINKKYGRSDSNSTNLSFNFSKNGGMSTQALELYGGIGIYIVGQNGAPSSNILISNKFEAASISLPNGLYKIYSVGWDGEYSSSPCTVADPCSSVMGQAHCSDPNGVSLNLAGGSTSVSLALSQSNCAFGSASVYSPGQSSPAISTFKPIKLYACAAPTSLPTCTAVYSWDVLLETVVYKKDASGNMVIDETANADMGCHTGVTESGLVTGRNFPASSIGASTKPFAMRARVYNNGSSCTGALIAEYLFKDGVANFASSPGGSDVYFDYYNGGSADAALYLAGPGF